MIKLTIRFKLSLLLFIPLLLLSCTGSSDQHVSVICDKSDIVSSKLITVDEAKDVIENDHLYIPIEISKKEEYTSGHLPRAINTWRPDFRTNSNVLFSGMICNPIEFEQFLQSLGMSDQNILLLYDNKGGCDAMRLAWVFDFYGFQKYKVINGGKKLWIQSGFELDTVTTKPIRNLDFKFESQPDSSLYATYQDVLASLGNGNIVLVDTREDYEFLGLPFISNEEVLSYKAGAYARGCIPGAKHLNWSEQSDLSSDDRFKCIKDLEYNLERKGITRDKEIIVYCQSGSRSSHTAFVLRELLDYPNVKNYDGSWIEWSYYYSKGNTTPITQIASESDCKDKELELLNTLNKVNG